MSPEELLARFWTEVQEGAPWLAALVPSGRRIGAMEVITLAPLVMGHLATPGDQVGLLDALARAYARAAGLHLQEVP